MPGPSTTRGARGSRAPSPELGRRAAWAFVAALAVSVPSPGSAAPADPIPAIDLTPPRQILFQWSDRGPLEAVPAGSVTPSVRAAYFAAVSDQQRGGATVALDVEGARFDLGGAWAPVDDVSLEITLPLVVYFDGVLDPVVDAIDRAVGTPSPQRKQRGQNVYAFEVESPDGRRFEPDPGHFGLGDLILGGRYRLLAEDRAGWAPDLSVSGALELPTGDASLAHGNGAVDFGAELEAGRSLGDFRLSLAFGLVVPGGLPAGLDGFDTRAAVSALGAIGYTFADAWGVIAQVDYRQAPYGGTPLDVFGSDSAELTVGLRWEPPDSGWSVDAGFVEGLVNGASPDFSVVSALRYRFGAAPEGGP